MNPGLRYHALLLMLCVFLMMLVSADHAYGNAENSRPEKNITKMTLADSVFLALRSNRTIESAYLDRVVQKFDLIVAEDKFVPNVDLDGSAGRFEDDIEYTGIGLRTETTTDSAEGTITVSETIPTGGTFAFSWTTIGKSQNMTGLGEDSGTSNGWQIFFSQPLLKGGGIDVNTASIQIARLDEQSNILSLKSTVIQTVTSVILAYRDLVRAKQQVDISKASMKRSEDLLETNKLLIAAGRMAAMEIVQTEADVANKKFYYEAVLKNFDDARLNLLELLDIDIHTRIAPLVEKEYKAIAPDIDKCLDTAFLNRPDYLDALLDIELAQVDEVLAKNNRLWDLSLDGYYDDFETKDIAELNTKGDEWRVGLTLNIPIYGDLTRKQRVLTAETEFKKAEIRFKERKSLVEIEVQDAVLEVKTKLKQVQLARLARELNEKKVEIEREKLKEGRSTNFQLVSFQNDLVNAQNNELNTVIAYLNSLTLLDQTLGSTLDTWKIELKK